MGLRVRTNVQSLVAQRHMQMSGEEMNKATERLASGYRINKGADDAAGFAISEVLRADIRGLTRRGAMPMTVSRSSRLPKAASARSITL